MQQKNSQLTVEQRIEAYNYVLNCFKKDIRHKEGICVLLTTCTGRLPCKENYPELFLLKPDPIYNTRYWFPLTVEGMQQRIELLQKAISLCIQSNND